jgi:hypothetical protein
LDITWKGAEKKMYKSIGVSLLFVIFSYGCAGTLQNYHPKSSEGVKIKAALTSYQSVYNEHDSVAFMGLFHENAQIMSPKDGSLLTRALYSDAIARLFEEYPTLVLGKPYVYLLESKDRAVVEVLMHFDDYRLASKVSYLREGNQWLIKKLVYF